MVSRLPYGLLRSSVALGGLLLACSLTSDDFHPVEVDGLLRAAPGQEAVASPPPASPAEAPAKPPGDPCSAGELAGCGGVVGLAGAICESDLDCDSRVCAAGACAEASCDDGRENGDEEGVDCGGACARACSTGCGDQCAPSCDDGVRNQDETGVDCGGDCPSCPAREPCGGANDCQSGVCSPAGCPGGVERCCQPPSCDDGVRNGNEPFTDCGNAACGGCPNDNPCNANAQCESDLCQAGTCRPQPCANGVRNGSETDVDCGGNDASCPRCDVGDLCAGNGDCRSNSCINGRCADCDDGVRNGAETGVDCGGGCGLCAPGRACGADAECQSGLCQDGRCCGGVLGDCTRCARRIAGVINCNTNGPAGAADCTAFLDCLADNPGVCSVRHAPGCSEDPGGVCNHTRFGTNEGPGVGLADAILGTAGCTF